MFTVLSRWIAHYVAPIPTPQVQSYASTFVYDRLPTNTRCFRVFYLTPRDGDDSFDKVHCGRLSVVDLDDDNRPPYNALSYCWEGSIEPSPYARQRKDRVIVENTDGTTGQLLISAALSTAMHHLRLRTSPDVVLPLFIDQICIDQGDSRASLGEKSRQIGLMGQIYSHSACVVAWLDVATEDTDAFFDFVPRISGSRLLGRLVDHPESVAPLLKSAMERHADLGEYDGVLRQDMESVIELTREHWDWFPHRGFLDVCRRRWFRRIWIVQEGCLGINMVFVCGRRSCSVRELEMVTNFQILASSVDRHLMQRRDRHRQLRRDREAQHDALMSSTLASRILRERSNILKPSSVGHSSHRGLVGLVSRFNVDMMAQGPWVRLGSSDSRDYIYALRGLAAEGDPVSNALVTDYTKEPDEIFTDFTRLLYDPALGTPSIDTLLLSQMETKKLCGLPSWVPDWSTNIVLPCAWHAGCSPVFSAGWNDGNPSTPCEVDVSTAGTLRTRGVALCEIDQLGKHFMEISSPPKTDRPESVTVLPRSIFDFFREVRTFCEIAHGQPGSASIPSHSRLDEAVWITTTGGHGLELTDERDLLGRSQVNGKPLLGFLWNFQLEMDVLPTILKRRKSSLMLLTEGWATSIDRMLGNDSGLYLGKLRASLVYWAKRLVVELRHIYWCQKFFLARPFIKMDAVDHLYHGVFGAQQTELGTLKSVLERHVRRKCFISKAGHVGLGPVNTRPGDVVVVLVGSTVPIILRPGFESTSPWEYVGEAYCHGFMHGEALRERGAVELRWFTIG